MKNIRSCIFETNSSSSHSISISYKCDTFDTIVPDENGVITLTGGGFGWEIERYYDAYTKANYCAIDCTGYTTAESALSDLHKKNMLIKVIKEHTGAEDVVFDINFDWNKVNYSYIDHQSVGTSSEAFESEDALRNFIFNPNSVLKTDNDNH